VSKFLSGLGPLLRYQVRGQILRGDNIPTLTATFSRVMCVSIGDGMSSGPSIEQSAWFPGVIEVAVVVMIVILEDVDPLEGGRGPYGGRQSGFDKGPCQCRHCERNNHYLGSAGINLIALNGQNWLILTLLPLMILLMLLQPLLIFFFWFSHLILHRLSMIGCANSSSLRIIIQQLMHPLQVECL